MRSSPFVAAALLALGGCNGITHDRSSGSSYSSDAGGSSRDSGSSSGSDAGSSFACACDAGRCLFSLASVPTGPHALAVDGATLYFLTECAGPANPPNGCGNGALMSVPVCGGTPTTLWQEKSPVQVFETESLAASSGTVFWSYIDSWGSNPSGPVMAMPERGGTATTLATGQQLIAMGNGMTANATDVYWNVDFCNGECIYSTTPPQGSVWWAPVGGGSGGTVVTDPGSFSGVGLDGASIYWANSPQGTVVKAPVAGGAETTLATGQSRPSFLVTDSTNAYWINLGLPPATSDIVTLPVGGGTPVTLASNQSYPRGLAADGASVYWVTYDGAIMKAPKSGGAPVTLASGQDTGSDAIDVIAVDATSVYWATGGGIMKLTPK